MLRFMKSLSSHIVKYTTIIKVFIIFNGCLVTIFSHTAYSKTSLSLQDILLSAEQSYPKILQAQQKLLQAEAELLSAEGGFDTELQQHTRVRTSGYYDGLFANQKIIKPLQNFNAKVFAEYRYADGQFPVYEDEYVTLEGGEINVGVSFSLLRNRDIDTYRLALKNSKLNVAMQKSMQSVIINDIQYEAAKAYLDWFSAYQQLTVYKQLLTTAQARQTALEKRVKLGDVAQITLLDNKQALLKREAEVIKAKNTLEVHALKLSLYWRDEKGKPQDINTNIAPEELPLIENILNHDLDALIKTALQRHPDIAQIENVLEQTKNTYKLNKNDLLPNVDIYMKTGHDLGAGSETRDGLESMVGLEFSMPLERRKAKGKIDKTNAKLKELTYIHQQLQEALSTTLQQTYNKYKNSIQQADVSAQRAEIAQQLQALEQERFDQGASDIFLLNLREESSASANIEAITTEVTYLLAAIELLGRTYTMGTLYN